MRDYRRCRKGGKGVGFKRNGCRTCAVKLSVPARRINNFGRHYIGDVMFMQKRLNVTNAGIASKMGLRYLIHGQSYYLFRIEGNLILTAQI